MRKITLILPISLSLNKVGMGLYKCLSGYMLFYYSLRVCIRNKKYGTPPSELNSYGCRSNCLQSLRQTLLKL